MSFFIFWHFLKLGWYWILCLITNEFVTSCTLIQSRISCHFDFSIMWTCVLNCVCQKLSWFPMTIAITSFLTMRSLAINAYFLSIWWCCIHDILCTFILINSHLQKHYKQNWRMISVVVVWVCISEMKDWINYSATQ